MIPKIESKIDIINYLIRRNGYKSYLEIGYLHGETFDRIKCTRKDSVDINPKSGAKYIMSSNRFFRTYLRKYNIILIDACHKHRQVGIDIRNALKHLTRGGTIILHDCNPPTVRWQAWNGTVWRAVLYIRQHCQWLTIRTIDIDHGVGIIQRGYSALYNKECRTFEEFDKKRKNILNLIHPVKFLALY